MLSNVKRTKVEEVVVATLVSREATSVSSTMLTLSPPRSSSTSCSLATSREGVMSARSNKGSKDPSEVGIKKI